MTIMHPRSVTSLALGGVSLLEAMTFVLGAIAHTGARLSFGTVEIAEPRIVAASIVELVCALALTVGAVGLLARRRWGWRAALIGHVVAFMSVVLGMAALAAGAGPRTAINDVYHRVILVALASMLLVLRRRAVRARL